MWSSVQFVILERVWDIYTYKTKYINRMKHREGVKGYTAKTSSTRAQKNTVCIFTISPEVLLPLTCFTCEYKGGR